MSWSHFHQSRVLQGSCTKLKSVTSHVKKKKRIKKTGSFNFIRICDVLPFWNSSLDFLFSCPFHFFPGSDRSVSLCQFRGLRVVYRPGWNWSSWRHRRRRLWMEREWRSFQSVGQSVVTQVKSPKQETSSPGVVANNSSADPVSCLAFGKKAEGVYMRAKLFSSRLRHKNNAAV